MQGYVFWIFVWNVDRFLGVLIIVMKTKTFTVLANERALPVLRNAEENLKNKSGNHTIHNKLYGTFSKNLLCFRKVKKEKIASVTS